MATTPHHPAPTGDSLIDPSLTHGQLTDRIVGVNLREGFAWKWMAMLGIALACMTLGLISLFWLLLNGVGIWGLNIPVAWGFAIINFVWWIGIGHAGTLISAILLLLRQPWRTSINRFAEAMTLFAVACAGLFPILHLGRIWKFYYLLPYPNTFDLWPQWRSPLMWDVFAVTTYSLVSLLFWYLGLIPDLATMRDAAKRPWVKIVTGAAALGWRGSAKHWQRYQTMYLLLAGLATPLVVSVHSIVSFDFAVSIIPGWHTTVFPPYFVAGAIFSGFAMVLMLAIPMRAAFNFRDIITPKHLDNMAKVMLVAGLIVAYGYIFETFTAWLSGDQFEQALVLNRVNGPYAFWYWSLIACNIVAAQTLWFRKFRRNPMLLFAVSCIIQIGMWLERYVIVVISLHRDFLTSSWDRYTPTFWDWSLYIGTIGLFGTLMLLFVRFLPSISISEVKELLHHHCGGHEKQSLEDSRMTDIGSQQMLTGLLERDKLYGIIAEFTDADSMESAAREVRKRGYMKVDAYSPFPIESMPESMGWQRSRIPWIVLAGAIVGGAGGYLLQWYTATQSYPFNIGGKPHHSWPSFIPITFESAVLCAAFFGVIGMFVVNKFPRPWHPVFDVRGFERASKDRFFLCIESTDHRFDAAQVRDLFRRLGAHRVADVPAAQAAGPKRIEFDTGDAL
jgi:Ni/Fe-hydrogenase subunit HybB-like protein